MRKILVTLLLFLCSLSGSFWASAQNGGWNIEAGISYPFYDRSTGVVVLAAERSSSGKWGSYTYSPVILPTVSVSVGRHLDKGPFSFRMGAYFNHASNKLYGAPDVLIERESILHLLPEVRLYYSEKASIRTYASLGAGLRIRIYSEDLGGDVVTGTHLSFSWQITPFGIEIGKQWYFNMCLGIGHAITPVGIGVGYKFR